jgi:hypothetical protein
MPKPPKTFGIQIETQAFSERFLDFLEGNPHQKFLKILSSSWQQQLGIKNELIA